MNLVSMDIPDDPGELPTWLDRHLVGLDLAALVAELTAVHGRGQAPTLDEVLGSQRPAVLADGLAALPRPALRQLLRHPALLVELQDLVLAEGGPYWEQLTGGSAALASLALHGERRLEEFLAAETRKAASPGPRATLPRGLPARWYRRPWFVSLATAAIVLITLYDFRDPLARLVVGQAGMVTAWGWENLDLTVQRSPGAYLQELADAGEKWFDQRPDDPATLARRIGQMRQGCSRLIFAEHPPLSPEDRDWLVKSCRSWGAKFDKSLQDLETGAPVAQVRAEMDTAVRDLVEALHKRAQERSA
jgi:hypothetical protein